MAILQEGKELCLEENNNIFPSLLLNTTDNHIIKTIFSWEGAEGVLARWVDIIIIIIINIIIIIIITIILLLLFSVLGTINLVC